MDNSGVTERGILSKISREKIQKLLRPELLQLYEGDDYLLIEDIIEITRYTDKWAYKKVKVQVKEGLMEEVRIMSPKGDGRLVKGWIFTPKGLAKMDEDGFWGDEGV